MTSARAGHRAGRELRFALQPLRPKLTPYDSHYVSTHMQREVYTESEGIRGRCLVPSDLTIQEWLEVYEVQEGVNVMFLSIDSFWYYPEVIFPSKVYISGCQYKSSNIRDMLPGGEGYYETGP